MNLKNIYKYRLIIALAIIATVMGVVKFKYRNTNWEQEEVLPTTIPSPTSSPQINSNYPLWEFIPYTGNGFKIDHYAEPLQLVIKIENEIDELTAREEIYEWMEENKVATESHKLIFEEE